MEPTRKIEKVGMRNLRMEDYDQLAKSFRNPLQAPKERSCGINNPPHPNLVPRSGTDYHPQHHKECVSPPSGNYMGWK